MTPDLPITTITAAVNAMLFFALTVSVISYRRSNSVTLGDNDDRILAKRIRGHGNAAEQIPIALILLTLAELQGAPTWILIIPAALFTIGRILHAAYFAIHGTHWRFRLYGMFLTLISQALFIIAVIVALLV